MRQLAELVYAHFKEPAFAAGCTALADEVHAALLANASVNHPVCGKILAFEVNGYGSCYLADDANVPSLLSLPYLQSLDNDDLALYNNTRRFILSENNIFYVKGSAAEGVSSSHMGRDMIWPMGIIMRAMTSSDDAEIAQSLHFLKTTHADTGFMHESFYKDNPAKFTRQGFAWANTLYGEFILKVLNEKPHLLTK